MTKYGNGGRTTVSPLQTAVDTEQLRNVQDSERYAIRVSGSKIHKNVQFFTNFKQKYADKWTNVIIPLNFLKRMTVLGPLCTLLQYF